MYISLLVHHIEQQTFFLSSAATAPASDRLKSCEFGRNI
jgi:hypothetical protein